MLLLHHAYLLDDLARFRTLLQTSEEAGKTGKKNKAQIDVNQVDTRGRTVLHLAASDGKWQYIEALLAIQRTDVLKPDQESGWTALHRALYNGHVACARELLGHFKPRSSAFRDLVGFRDFESNSAFDVYNSTVSGVNPGPHDYKSGSSDLFTFGSNANHTLGFSDADDRTYPERVHLIKKHDVSTGIKRFDAQKILDVSMAKYHTLVLTNEKGHNLYACGFSKDGRLGMPGSTRFRFEVVPIDECIVAVVAAQDHSLAVTEAGDLYTWGSNTSGQLGYDLEGSSFESTPRKVIKLSRETVLGVAASSIHSICYTSTSMYSWGMNEGQLGYELAPGESSVNTIPRKIAALTARVSQVTATRHATVCLLEAGEVLVFTNYGYFKLQLHLDRFASALKVSRPFQASGSSKIVKVVSGISKIAVMTDLGEVFAFVLDGTTQGIKPSSLARSIRPSRVWSLRTKHMTVRDLSFGDDRTLMFCTESGDILIGTQRTTKHNNDKSMSDFKFSRVPGITRVVQVRGNATGAYAAIRSDAVLAHIELDTTDLAEDLLCTLPYASLILEEEEIALDHEPDVDEDSEDIDRVPKHVSNALRMVQDLPTDPQLFSQLDEPHSFVIEVAGCRLALHEAICRCRSPTLNRLLSATTSCNIGGIELDTRDIRTIRLGQPYDDIAAAVIVIHYIYTDIVLAPWIGADPKRQQSMNNLRERVRQLAGCLELINLSKAISNAYVVKELPTLVSNISKLQFSPLFSTFFDTRLNLASNEHIDTHSVILCARSEFFEAMFTGAWLESRRADSPDKLVEINLKHINRNVMAIVLKHIFGDQDISVFDEVDAQGVEDLLELITSVLAASNEFILPRLKQSCQIVLRRYVHRKNVAVMLQEADLYAADALKEACLDYCSRNLQLLLENGLLDELNLDLIHDLELHIARKQIERMPVSKSNKLISETIQRNPDLIEASNRERSEYIDSLLSSTADHVTGKIREMFLTSALPLRSEALERSSSQTKNMARPSSVAEKPKGIEMPMQQDLPLMSFEAEHSNLSKLFKSAPSDVAIPFKNSALSGTASTTCEKGNSVSEASSRDRSVADPTRTGTEFRHVHTAVESPKAYISDLFDFVTPAKTSRKNRKLQSSHMELERLSPAAPGLPSPPANQLSPWVPVSRIVTPLSSINTAQSSDMLQSPEISKAASSQSRIAIPQHTTPVRVPNPRASSGGASAPTASRDSNRRTYTSHSISPAPSNKSRSLAEIIAQEEDEKNKVAEFRAKRSMKEIQEHEESVKNAIEFEKWFEKESLRIQAEETLLSKDKGKKSVKTQASKPKRNRKAVTSIPGEPS